MMAETPPRNDVSVRDMDRVKLLAFELKYLLREMREAHSPHAESLARIVRRFTGTRHEDDR